MARLDRFFGSSQRIMEHEGAKVQHIEKQVSDYSMILLDSNPCAQKKKRMFVFDKRWVGNAEVEEVIRATWGVNCIRLPMFRVASKIMNCRKELNQY